MSYIEANMRIFYDTKYDTIRVTSKDKRLSGVNLTIAKGTASDIALRDMLKAEGVIPPQDGKQVKFGRRDGAGKVSRDAHHVLLGSDAHTHPQYWNTSPSTNYPNILQAYTPSEDSMRTIQDIMVSHASKFSDQWKMFSPSTVEGMSSLSGLPYITTWTQLHDDNRISKIIHEKESIDRSRNDLRLTCSKEPAQKYIIMCVVDSIQMDESGPVPMVFREIRALGHALVLLSPTWSHMTSPLISRYMHSRMAMSELSAEQLSWMTGSREYDWQKEIIEDQQNFFISIPGFTGMLSRPQE